MTKTSELLEELAMLYLEQEEIQKYINFVLTQIKNIYQDELQ